MAKIFSFYGISRNTGVDMAMQHYSPVAVCVLNRAVFVVVLVLLVLGYTNGEDQCSGDVMNIECESENYLYKTCPINESRVIIGAKVIAHHSKSDCNGPLPQNSTESGSFGFSDNTLWVDGGCYADFEICHVARNFSTTLNLSPSSSFYTTPSTSTLLTHSTVVHAESTETAVSGDVPVAAIVVPVLTVVVLAIAVLLFVMWRRRKLNTIVSTKLNVIQHSAKHGMQAGQLGSDAHYYTAMEQQNESKAVVLTTNATSYKGQTLKQQASSNKETDEYQGDAVYSNSDNKGASNVVSVQTLPDEEYNVIGIETNKAVADTYYDSLKQQ